MKRAVSLIKEYYEADTEEGRKRQIALELAGLAGINRAHAHDTGILMHQVNIWVQQTRKTLWILEINVREGGQFFDNVRF